MLLLPISAITFARLMRPYLTLQGLHPAAGSLVAGALFAVLSWHLLSAQRVRAATSKAVFIGLVVAHTFLIPRTQRLSSSLAFVLSVTLLYLSLQHIQQ